MCQNIEIITDSLCELSPIEYFLIFLEYESTQTPIIISPNQARVIINDTSECGKSISLSHFCALKNSLSLPIIVPNVTLTAPSAPFYEGTSQTLTCTATLHLPVNSDVTISLHWMPATNSDRVTIFSLSIERSPFISTLTLNPLVMSDTGLYSCEATVHSPSQNTITQHSQQLNLNVTGTNLC